MRPKKKGLTLIELLISIAVVTILAGLSFVLINPLEQQKKGRDTKRISDIGVLESAVNQYFMDNKVYPDSVGVLRTSNVAIDGSTDLADSKKSWIDANLSKYLSHMVVDPTNSNTYHYSYIHDNVSYEVDAVLEIPSAVSQNDGGTNASVYETGTNLSLL